MQNNKNMESTRSIYLGGCPPLTFNAISATYPLCNGRTYCILKAYDLHSAREQAQLDHLLKKMKEVIKPFIDFKDPRLCPFFGTAVSDASDTSRSPFCGVVSLQFGSFTLRDHLDGNWLSPEELMPAIKAIAGGMAVLHSNGTVHGKLVPEHVSECDGFWKLINYGLWEVENEIKAIKGYETTPPPTKKDDIRAFFQIVTSIGSPVDPAIFSCDSFEQILQKL